MSYRDMTFCQGADCKHFNGCVRALTPEVQKAADEWAKRAGMGWTPISIFGDPRLLDCYEIDIHAETPQK